MVCYLVLWSRILAVLTGEHTHIHTNTHAHERVRTHTPDFVVLEGMVVSRVRSHSEMQCVRRLA